jgi:hypothetical protein
MAKHSAPRTARSGTGVLFGQLGAAPEAKAFYSDLTRAAEFSSTAAWAGLDPAAFDGLAPTRPGRLGCPPGRAPCWPPRPPGPG